MAVISAEVMSPVIKTTPKMEREVIALTPQARPSNPSIKLIALESPTIQKSVIGIANIPNSMTVPNMVT